MARSVEKMQRDLELALNEIGADQVVNRIVLQCLIFNLVAANGPEFLSDLKQQALGAISNTLPATTDPQGSERRKQLTMMRAESLFQEMEEAMGAVLSPRDPPASN